MKNKNKHNAGIDAFLDSSGVLEQGTKEDIQKAKKIYWNTYKKNWNKTKRKECKSFEILLNSKEFKFVISQSEKQRTSPTNYIKMCAVSNPHILDHKTIGEIRELIVLHHNKIQVFIEENELPMEFGAELLEQISMIEKRVLELFSLLK